MTIVQPPPQEGAAALMQSPYVGLMPYGEGDSDFFFGRERATRVIVTNLRGSPLTLMYGGTGVGKSSLLLAGVLPRLRERARPEPGERPAFSVAVVRQWHDDPVVELAEALRLSIQEASGIELEPWRSGTPLTDAVREWTKHVRTALLILDQFEEYFLYHADERGPGSFAGELAALVEDRRLRVHVLVSLREDALSLLDRFKATIPGLFGNYLRVDHLDRASARRAIEGPIEEHGRRLPAGEEPMTIEPELVEMVLDQVRTGRLTLSDGSAAAGTTADSGDDRVETPFLQLVMERLWATTVQRGERRLSLATLQELGGAEEIVSHHLGEVLAQLGEREQLAAQLFAYLVTPSMTKIAQAPKDLAYWTEQPLDDVADVLRELASGDRRILRSVPPPLGDASGVERYEIFHDVLAQPISEWRSAQEQVREREELAKRLEAERAERELAERRRRRAFAAAGGALVLAAVAVVACVLALRAQHNANEQQHNANEQRAAARAAAFAGSARANLDTDPELSLLLAAKGVGMQPTQIATDALRQAIADSRVRAVLRGGRSRACPACRIQGIPDAPPGDVAISPNGLIAAWTGSRLVVWNPVDGTSREVARGALNSVQAGGPVAFAADGRTVLRRPKQLAGDQNVPPIVSPDRATVARIHLTPRFTAQATIRRDGRVLAKPFVPLDAATPVIFSRDGKWMLVLTDDQQAQLWRLGARPSHQLLSGHTDNVLSAAFSPDGTQVATASADSTIRVWDTGTGQTFAVLRGHDGDVTGVAFSADGRMLASRGIDGTLRLWALQAGRVLRDSQAVYYARWSPDGRSVVTVGDKGVARLYDTRTWRRQTVRDTRAQITDAAFDKGGRLLEVGFDARGRSVLVVSVPGTGQRAVGTLERAVMGAAFLSSGPGIVSVDDGGLQFWTVDGSRLRPSRRLAGFPNSSSIRSSHGMLALADQSDGLVHLLREDGRGGERTLRAAPLTSNVYAASFSPDGRRLVTAGQQARIRIWRVSDGRLLQTLPPVPGTTFSAEFSPDGGSVITGGVDGAVRIWNAATGGAIAVLREHAAAVDAASFSPDGRWILSAGDDRTARIYSCEPCAGIERLRTLAHDRTSRDLTAEEIRRYGGG